MPRFGPKSILLAILAVLFLVGYYFFLNHVEHKKEVQGDVKEELSLIRQAIIADQLRDRFRDSVNLSAMRELIGERKDSVIIIKQTVHEKASAIDNLSDTALVRFFAEYEYTPYRP